MILTTFQRGKFQEIDMDKTFINNLTNYLNKNKSTLIQSENVTNLGLSYKFLGDKPYDVYVHVFVKKNTPDVELHKIPEYIEFEKQKISTVIIFDENVEHEGLPEYKMPKELE